MADLSGRILALEGEIGGYFKLLNDPSTSQDLKDKLLDVIKTRGENLTLLLGQQSVATSAPTASAGLVAAPVQSAQDAEILTLAGQKRAYDEALKPMVDVAPSSFGLPSDKHSWTNMYKGIHLKHHRPDAADCGVHVSLLSPALARFCEASRSVELERADYQFATTFCAEMCQVYENEEQRMIKANVLLSSYFGKSITRLSGQAGYWQNDGGIRCACGSDASNTAVALGNELKNEIGAGSAAPGEQGIGYYVKFTMESHFARKRSVCPALLVTIAGPNIGISGAVHSRGPCVDPIVPMLPLMVLPYDRPMMTAVARALKAAKLCIADLTSFYQDLPDPEPTDEETGQLLFPYPRSFQHNGVQIPFVYQRQLGDKLVFLARVTEDSANFKRGHNVLIKFTDSYCPEAHAACGIAAPILHACIQLTNGWYMVVMEHLTGRHYQYQQDQPERPDLQQQLREAVGNLHRNNLVHGDLRANNIMVVDDDARVCLIDFDWSGTVGEKAYPSFMNHINIQWPEGASDGQTLQFDHDLHWLKRWTT